MCETYIHNSCMYIIIYITYKQNGITILHPHTESCSFCPTGRKEMFYLTTHSTHFIYGYMASDIWLRTILIVRKETRCRHIGYSYRLTTRVLLYAPFHIQDNTYHCLCYTRRGALVWNSTTGVTKAVVCDILSVEWCQHVIFDKFEGRNYLIMHSTHIIYGYLVADRQEGNVLFNDTLNTFYLRLYGVRRMVRDYSDSERGNPLHGLLFSIRSKISFICTIP